MTKGDACWYIAVPFSFSASNLPKKCPGGGQPLRVHNRTQPRRDCITSTAGTMILRLAGLLMRTALSIILARLRKIYLPTAVIILLPTKTQVAMLGKRFGMPFPLLQALLKLQLIRMTRGRGLALLEMLLMY